MKRDKTKFALQGDWTETAGRNVRDTVSTTINKAKLSDVVHVFNLIQDGSRSGFFNNRYLEPRYQAGLGLQLFSICLIGRIRLPSGVWLNAKLTTIRQDGNFAGFMLILDRVEGEASKEIYMCAIAADHRRKGCGRLLLQTLLNKLPPDCIVTAECLPKASAMKSLLRNLDFNQLHAPPEQGELATEKFRYEKIVRIKMQELVTITG